MTKSTKVQKKKIATAKKVTNKVTKKTTKQNDIKVKSAKSAKVTVQLLDDNNKIISEKETIKILSVKKKTVPHAEGLANLMNDLLEKNPEGTIMKREKLEAFMIEKQGTIKRGEKYCHVSHVMKRVKNVKVALGHIVLYKEPTTAKLARAKKRFAKMKNAA